MNLIGFFVLAGFLVWVIQTSGPTKAIFKKLGEIHPLFEELRACDFCLGCWVIPWIAWALEINFLDPYYIPGFSEIASGIMASFVIHVFKIGFKDKYCLTVLE